MAREKDKQYVVTGAYVPMKVMTADGYQVRGFAQGAPVPELDPATFDHLLSHGLIAAEGEQPAAGVGPTASQLAQQARAELAASRQAVADAQVRLDNAQAAVKTAEDAESRDSDTAERAAKARQEAAARLTANGGPADPAAADDGGRADLSGVVPVDQRATTPQAVTGTPAKQTTGKPVTGRATRK